MFLHKQFEPFLWFVYGAIITTALCGLIYVVAQQNYRQNLNDPQLQIAGDTIARLEAGGAILDQIPKEKVSMDTSLAPFVIIYDTEGKPIAGNGYVGAELPTPPKGVFDQVSFWESGHTWEPRGDVRIAAVIKPFVGREANGYVLVGRNMKVVEDHVATIGITIGIAWLVTMGALFVFSCLLSLLRRE